MYTDPMLRAAVLLYNALLGFALLFAPWSRLWQDNWLFWHAGSLQSLLMSGPVRGAVSGFGAAFLIRAAGRLAGFSLVEEDEDATSVAPPESAPPDTPSADAAPSPEDDPSRNVSMVPLSPPPREESGPPLATGGGSEAAPAGIRER